MSLKCLSVSLLLTALSFINTEARLEFPPTFIADHACNRNDPSIEKCMMKALQDLRPYLVEGVPELNIPALEPLEIPEMHLLRGKLKANIKNIRVWGGTDFTIKLKLGVDRLTTNIYLELPLLYFEFEYDIDLKIMNMPVKGFGTCMGNITGITADVITRGRLDEQPDGNHLKFEKFDVQLGVEDYNIDIGNQYKGRTLLNDANKILNANRQAIIKASLPSANRHLAKLLPDYVNKITDAFIYDDFFIDDEFQTQVDNVSVS